MLSEPRCEDWGSDVTPTHLFTSVLDGECGERHLRRYVIRQGKDKVDPVHTMKAYRGDMQLALFRNL